MHSGRGMALSLSNTLSPHRDLRAVLGGGCCYHLSYSSEILDSGRYITLGQNVVDGGWAPRQCVCRAHTWNQTHTYCLPWPLAEHSPEPPCSHFAHTHTDTMNIRSSVSYFPLCPPSCPGPCLHTHAQSLLGNDFTKECVFKTQAPVQF